MTYRVLSLLIAAVLSGAGDRGASCPELAVPDSLAHGVLVDDADERQVEITAYWAAVTEEACGAYSGRALYDGGVRADGVVRFRPLLVNTGPHAVYMYWPSLEEHALATNAPITIRHDGGIESRTLDLKEHANRWTYLGTFAMRDDTDPYVEIRNDAADGVVVADAVVFVPADDAAAR